MYLDDQLKIVGAMGSHLSSLPGLLRFLCAAPSAKRWAKT